jgi:KDO2-lipid IV(A) lauroyltransferase
MNYFSYRLIRALLFPFSLLSYKSLHRLGSILGVLMFPLLTKYRKRALSNLAIASDLHLSPSEIEKIAKESLGNLFITALEYGKLSKEKNIQNVATCINPEAANTIIKSGKTIIFFCAHLANWEILFLDGTSRMKGLAIGQPIENRFLYNWVLRMREKFGGTIVEPKQAVKEGLRALKKGVFLGIVGDQSLPESSFSSSFLGRQAFTSPLPALLSHRSGCPIIVPIPVRKEGRYFIHYSNPIWPDDTQTMDDDIPRLMDASLHLIENAIKENPGQWLWQHNKWKQQGPGKIKKQYRHDTMAIFLPLDRKKAEELLNELDVLREIYPTEFISFFVPEDVVLPENLASETIYYKKPSELKKKDYRFKLIFNFTSDKTLSDYFLNLATFIALTPEKIAYLSKAPQDSLSSQLKRVILYAS